MAPGHQPGPGEVADGTARVPPPGDLEQVGQVPVLEAVLGVYHQAVAEVGQLTEELASEMRSLGPPEHDRQIGDEERRHHAGQVTRHLAVRVQEDPLGDDRPARLLAGGGAHIGLQLERGSVRLGEQQQGARRVVDRKPVEYPRDRFDVVVGFDHGDQVEDVGPGLRGGVLGRLVFPLVAHLPADAGQLLLDRVDVDDPSRGQLAHGRLQRRPSRSIRASASSGPQLPAA